MNDPVPDSWQHSTIPETRLAWLEQEHQRLLDRFERERGSYDAALMLSKQWQANYQMECRLHDKTVRRTRIDALKSAYSYLRQIVVTESSFPSKYRREGAQQLLNAIPEHIQQLEAIQRSDSPMTARPTDTRPDYRHEPEGA